jgi:radical SAM protein with 4Fe4S-binding SPASM domain
LTLDRIKEIVEEIDMISNHASYTITGGEPLKSPMAIDIMNYLHQKNKEVILLTNGLLITEENSKDIAKVCNMIKISIDGSSENINSKTRGNGGFAKAFHGYELLKQEGANVLASMTVTKENIHDISNMVKLFGNKLTLQPFFKSGRGTKNADLQITGKEYYDALASVEGLQPMGQIGAMLDNLRNRGTTKCAMAGGEIYIAENGDVYPCQMLMEEEFIGGNIEQESIESILDSDIFKELRTFSSLENEECRTCPIKLLCGGACRARSYLDTGSIFKNSDFCEYEKLAYINGIFEVSTFE